MATKEKSKKELTTIEPGDVGTLAAMENRFLALSPDSDIGEMIEANMEGQPVGEQHLATVKMPTGGMTIWTVPGVDGEELVASITGVLVHKSMRGILWPTKQTGNLRPYLITDDLVTARRVGEDIGDLDPRALEAAANEDGTYRWKDLPYTQFGSGIDESGKPTRGKRSDERQILCLLREGDLIPLIVSLSGGSLTAWQGFMAGLLTKGVIYFRAVVELTLEKVDNAAGIAYSRAIPRRIETLDMESARALRKIYGPMMEKILKQMPDQE
jgi:hypothetical protein